MSNELHINILIENNVRYLLGRAITLGGKKWLNYSHCEIGRRLKFNSFYFLNGQSTHL